MSKKALYGLLDETFHRKHVSSSGLNKFNTQPCGHFRFCAFDSSGSESSPLVLQSQARQVFLLGSIAGLSRSYSLKEGLLFYVPRYCDLWKARFAPFAKLGRFIRRSFFSGYAIKQTKGGVLIGVNGLFCFVPSSLAETYRTNRSTRTVSRYTQTFYHQNTTLNVGLFKEANVNGVFSKKPVGIFLKKSLKLFTSVCLQERPSFSQAIKKICLYHRDLRAISKRVGSRLLLQTLKETFRTL